MNTIKELIKKKSEQIIKIKDKTKETLDLESKNRLIIELNELVDEKLKLSEIVPNIIKEEPEKNLNLENTLKDIILIYINIIYHI